MKPNRNSFTLTYFFSILDSRISPFVKSSKYLPHHKQIASRKIEKVDWLDACNLSNTDPLNQLEE